MIIVTGGAGFIGSILQHELAVAGHETVIVDWLGQEGKWRNIARHPPSMIVCPEELEVFLAKKPPVEAIFHMGAISETTARDGDLVWRTNVVLSKRLWDWSTVNNARFFYASSAATYGSGAFGFDDDPLHLARLKPLNLYGWSKHVFDLQVVNGLAQGEAQPPQWAGLKFFNVYGPNEYHKGKMISVVKVKFDEVLAGHPARLFRSDTEGVDDGYQRRDFIWVGDVVNVLMWLFANPSVTGLFNLGTGVARTYRDLAYAVCDAMGTERRIEFIDMPQSLQGQYQSFTEASLVRLRRAGYCEGFTTLEDGICKYIRGYLLNEDRYK